MTTGLDLTAAGIGSRAAAPVAPPRTWSMRRVSAHSIVKAHRVWMAAVEPFADALSLDGDEVARLRPLMLVLGTAVYEWDEETEREPATTATDHPGHASLLEQLVADLVPLDEDMRADVARLRRLFELEQHVGDLGRALDRFTAVAGCRSADIQLFMRVMMRLTGAGAAGIVDVMRPCFEVVEVVDDLETALVDQEAGSFNSFDLLRDAYGPRQAREHLDRFAADRAAYFAAAWEAAGEAESRPAFVLRGRPASRSARRMLGAAAATPRPIRRWLFRTVVLTRVRHAFAPYWQRPEFRDPSPGAVADRPVRHLDVPEEDR